MQWLTTA